MKPLYFILTSSLILSACNSAQQREYEVPAEPAGLKDFNATLINQEKFNAAKPISTWWQQLNDPILNQLIENSLQHNLDVQEAIANLFAARGVQNEAEYDKYPTVTADASYSRERSSLTARGTSTSFGDNTINSLQYGIDANWELDLFNRVSQRIATQEAFAKAAEADLQHVYVTIAAEVAGNYIELRGAQYRLDIAQRNAKSQEGSLNTTQRLMEGGTATKLDVARAEGQLNTTLASIPTLKAEVNTAISRLSVLSGEVPTSLQETLAPTKQLPNVPVSVALGKAEDLLKRRPDIRSAERQLAASVAEYNVAVTDLFPTVNIIGALGFIATNFVSLGTGSAIAASLGPSMKWAAFDLGRVRSRIDQRDAESMAALARYEKTVLTALQELNIAINDFTQEEQRRKTLRLAAESNAEAAKAAQLRFRGGVDDYLDVLDAERSLLNAEDSLAVSEINVLIDLISIYKALGGGWEIKPEHYAKSE